MKKILVFGASSSKQSINKTFATYVANQLHGVDLEVVDLRDYEMPLYSVDKESEIGIPQKAHDFKKALDRSDGFVISFAEHNGMCTVAYKNIYDWVSRIEQEVWKNKPMLLLATSPGARGGQGVLSLVSAVYGFLNKNTIVTFSLPSYYENFSPDKGVQDASLFNDLYEKVKQFQEAL